MTDEDTVEPQDVIEQVAEQQEVAEAVEAEPQEESVEQIEQKTQVPLSALQKERKKRQELELELQWERQRAQQSAQQKPPEEDNSKYETATKEDLNIAQNEMVRAIEEKLWIKNNPEKYERINEFLPQFLKQRPNLARAINEASNRYEEAFTLMEALTPKEKQQIAKPPAPKKTAPNAPGGVPKAAALNEAVDVMTMSDAEFSKWRQEQKRRRS